MSISQMHSATVFGGYAEHTLVVQRRQRRLGVERMSPSEADQATVPAYVIIWRLPIFFEDAR